MVSQKNSYSSDNSNICSAISNSKSQKKLEIHGGNEYLSHLGPNTGMSLLDLNSSIDFCNLNNFNTAFGTIYNYSKFNDLIRFWVDFSGDMNYENLNKLINSIVLCFGKDIFAKFLLIEDKMKYLYSCNDDPRFIYMKVEYLRYRISGNFGPVSMTDLIKVMFGDSTSELSKLLLNLDICDIQPLILILSSHYININWYFVHASIPGISGRYKISNRNFKSGDNNVCSISCDNSTINFYPAKYSIHLSSFWILRDCIYIILLLVYETRTKVLDENLFDFYFSLLKDLTYKRTLLLSGPKLSNSSDKVVITKERFCITSAIPLLDVLIQFLLNSRESDDFVLRILSRISMNESKFCNIKLQSSTIINFHNDSPVISKFSSDKFNNNVGLNKFQNFNSSIEMLLKGGEFLLVYPTQNIFKRLKKLFSRKKCLDKNIKDCFEVSDELKIQLENHFPKVFLKLSNDLSFLVFQVLDGKFIVKGRELAGKHSVEENTSVKFSLIKRFKKRKIPISNVISLDVGYFAKPDCISLPSPDISIPCFCCDTQKLDKTSVLYRTLVIRTKKNVYKFLSVEIQDLCVKQWQAAIKQFVEYKISQVNTDNSKGIVKITKYRKNKFSHSDELFNPHIKKKRWYEEILPNWGIHWNCNSIPISVYDIVSPDNKSLTRSKHYQEYSKPSFENYLKVVSDPISKDDFCSWFFGSHWINQNKSLYISASKQKITNIRTIPVFKGCSFENFNSIDDWSSVSNWIHILHQKINSSYHLHSIPIVDRGVRFGTPNSQLLLDLWNTGVPINLRNKIWQIALGNEIKVSNELFYIWHFQSIACIREYDLNSTNIALLSKYAREIQSIYYKNEKICEKKKISPYVDTRDRVLNISSSSFVQFILLKTCGFARDWDYSYKKGDMKKVSPLIDINEYYIDSECVSVPKLLKNLVNSKNEAQQGRIFCSSENYNKLTLSNYQKIESNKHPDFSSLEVLTLNRFIESHGNPGISVKDCTIQNDDNSTNIFHESQYSISNLTIIKGLLDTIGALITHSPSIGFQPCIIKYILVFLMYMEPPTAFKCILNMLSSSDFLNSNTNHIINKLESSLYGIDIDGFFKNESLKNITSNSDNVIDICKNDRFWLVISHIFQSFVYSNFPQLYQHLLYTLGVNFEVIVITWFKNIFMDTLSFPIVLIIWDNFLLLGLPFLFQAGLSLLKICESQLLRCESILGALNILIHNCEHNSFVIKPDTFVTALRDIQATCEVTKIVSIISHYNILEQKRWIMRSQQSIKNFLINRGYYCTSTSSRSKEQLE
ncbi:hypothetical protein FG386_002531 [Cryptosporidium ryanae]|uniref:uncharacterized protein n=1 Tax=Cryptosporidium ryanae TaxID=515981 RepID=UPI003519F8CB|nr:hypothetical protein FG386_002531 [Cryptosporidium ryanae]